MRLIDDVPLSSGMIQVVPLEDVPALSHAITQEGARGY